MRLTESDLVGLFDRFEHRREAERSAGLLAALCPEHLVGDVSLGDRDRLFLKARREQFGARGVQAKVQCGGCGEWMSLDLGAGFALPPKVSDTAQVTVEGTEYILRLPCQDDLLRTQGGQFPMAQLCPDAPWESDAFCQAAEAALDAADPALDLVFDLTCPECGDQTECGLDTLDFLWRDVEACALRFFADVGVLARAFGWSEAETAALSPRRRRRYVEMVT